MCLQIGIDLGSLLTSIQYHSFNRLMNRMVLQRMVGMLPGGCLNTISIDLGSFSNPPHLCLTCLVMNGGMCHSCCVIVGVCIMYVC